MDQLKGSLRFIPLPAVTQFIAGLGSTGRLEITQGAWAGAIALRDGQVVGAQLGGERGRAALEGMVLALTEAEFAFIDGLADADADAVLSRDEVAGYMAGLVAERERLQLGTNALASVPCLIDQTQNGNEATQVTIQAAALQLIPLLVYGHTLDQIAQRRGLARTLREVALLRAGGLVRLESTPRQAAAPAAAATQATVAPAPIRPLRPVPQAAPAASSTPAPRPVPAGVARRVNAWQASAAAASAAPAPAPRPVDMPRPRLVRSVEVAPSVEAALDVLPRGRSWRSTLRGWFIDEDAPRR